MNVGSISVDIRAEVFDFKRGRILMIHKDESKPPSRQFNQDIARRALQLRELGLTGTAIARQVRVTDKTIAKGIRWRRGMP